MSWHTPTTTKLPTTQKDWCETKEASWNPLFMTSRVMGTKTKGEMYCLEVMLFERTLTRALSHPIYTACLSRCTPHEKNWKIRHEGSTSFPLPKQWIGTLGPDSKLALGTRLLLIITGHNVLPSSHQLIKAITESFTESISLA